MAIWKYEVETKNGILAMGNAPEKASAAQNAVMAVGNDPFSLPKVVPGESEPKPGEDYAYTITITPMPDSTPTTTEPSATAV